MTKKHYSKHSSLNGFVRHPTQEEVQRYLNSCLLDNYLMNVCFSDNNEAAQLIVTTLLGRNDITVTETSVQKYLANFKTKSSVLDILAKDTQGKIYNIELQRVVEKATPLRARYYCGLIDRDLLKKGEDYEQLPELYVIFVTDGDFFGKGKQVYNIVRKVEETGDVYEDKVHIIYANAKHQDASPVGKLLSDLTCPDPEKMHNKVLSDAVREAKTEGGKRMGMWVEGYSMYEKERWDEAHSVGLNEGMSIGRSEGLVKGRNEGRETEKNAWIANLRNAGMSEAQIKALMPSAD